MDGDNNEDAADAEDDDGYTGMVILEVVDGGGMDGVSV